MPSGTANINSSQHISLAAISEGKHISLVICVRGNTYHCDGHSDMCSPVICVSPNIIGKHKILKLCTRGIRSVFISWVLCYTIIFYSFSAVILQRNTVRKFPFFLILEIIQACSSEFEPSDTTQGILHITTKSVLHDIRWMNTHESFRYKRSRYIHVLQIFLVSLYAPEVTY